MAVQGEKGGVEMPVDERGLPIIPGMSSEEIRKGFGLFFENKLHEAEEFFAKHSTIPLLSMGHSAMSFLRATMSLENVDIVAAKGTLSTSQKIAAQLAHKEGTIHSIGRWFTGGEYELTSAQIHCAIISAETYLLTANLQFLQESVLEKIKGGLNVRGAWKEYSRLWKQYPDPKPNEKDILDDETRTALQFGVGAFNLLCSVLPPKLLRIVSILGFPSNRKLALDLLWKVYSRDCVRSPLAGLALLTHHVILQCAFGTGKLLFEDQAKQIIDESLKKYPDSGLFLCAKARLERLHRNVEGSRQHFARALEVQKEWKQMAHLCYYDLGFCHLYLSQFDEAQKFFELLLEENEWSKGFYIYMVGICLLKRGEKEKALELLLTIPKRVARKFGGRMISIEHFVLRKVKSYCSPSKCEFVLPILEILYIWNAFTQMTIDALKEAQTDMDKWLGATEEKGEYEYVILLMLAAIHVQLGELDKAQAKCETIEANKKLIKGENWVIPFARYELAMLWARQDNHKLTERVNAKLKQALSYSTDYNFELRMHLRIHLAFDQLEKLE